MQLSVIILNYNVRYFLELCVLSTQKAIQNLDAEIIVIDNNSSDDSCAMMKQRFPNIKLIENPANLGFPKGNNIAVEWKVSNQLNLAGYEVEKSVDGRIFSKVTVQAVSSTNNSEAVYSWLDVNTLKGNNFYRIKAIDNGGSFRYSSIVKVVLGKINTTINISPNPVKGNLVNLQFNNQPAGIYNIRLFNAAGELVYSNLESHAGGSATLSFKLASSLTKGIYQLEIIAPDKTRDIQKLIVYAGN